MLVKMFLVLLVVGFVVYSMFPPKEVAKALSAEQCNADLALRVERLAKEGRVTPFDTRYTYRHGWLRIDQQLRHGINGSYLLTQVYQSGQPMASVYNGQFVSCTPDKWVGRVIKLTQ